MKKSIILFLTLTTMAGFSFAQTSDNSSSKPHFGIKGGLNFSNVYDTEGEEFKADGKFGLVAGAFFDIPFGDLLGFHPEILYSQKGFRASGTILGSTYKFQRTLNFIDVPLMLAVKPSPRLTLLVGPQYSFLVSQKDEYETQFISDEQIEEFENDNIRKNTLCFLAGADLNFNQMVLGGRVGWDITKNIGDGTSETPRYKNVWYQLTLGYRF
jgi:hypothetical protein